MSSESTDYQASFQLEGERSDDRPRKKFLGFDKVTLSHLQPQWLVLLAAWLGWGFDIFDGLLFTFAAPTCVPTLLGLELGR